MKKTCKIFLVAAMLLASTYASQAQVGINSTGNAPNSSAMLDVTAANKGVLIPNVELTGTTDAITISNPALSLLVYNTRTMSDVTPGYYYNSGTPGSPVWTRLLVAIPNLTGMVTSSGNATTVVTNANLTGEVTSVGNATTVTNSSVIAKVLTGYTSGAGNVAATDNLLLAIQKLNGNIKSLEENIIALGNYKILDIEGNQYKVVKIGTQTWMAENLKTTKYNDGTPITNVTDNASWAALTTGAYCDYYNTPGNSDTYGRLYNWFAVNTGKLAPFGWHVPTDAEWTTLTDYLGGLTVAGGKLKETGTSHWVTPNTGATNSTGFTALPSGDRYYLGGMFGDVGYRGYYWSSTAYNDTYAWNRGLFYDYATVGHLSNRKQNGFSVWCVRD